MEVAYQQFLKEFADKDSLVILISSSGNSENIVNCAKYCIDCEIKMITLSGFSETNKLKIDVVFIGCYSADAVIALMLFQDSTANALASSYIWSGGGNTRNAPMYLSHTMTAGTTSATTFKIRAGGDNAGTLSFNGRNGSRQYGGTLASSISITEISQ